MVNLKHPRPVFGVSFYRGLPFTCNLPHAGGNCFLQEHDDSAAPPGTKTESAEFTTLQKGIDD